MSQRYTGFTLAEVLITLGIIGVVAALTIPALINSTQDKELKVAWRKNFSVLSQATKTILDDNGEGFDNLCTSNNDDCLAAIYGKYLSAIKVCPHGTSGCFNNGEYPFKWLNGNVISGWSADSGLVLKDGSVLNIEYWDSTCNSNVGTAKDCGKIYVDVNGPKKPNTVGKDVFSIHVQKDGIKPYGITEDGLTCVSTGNGYGCGAAYLQGD